jgi:hypothetical protein
VPEAAKNQGLHQIAQNSGMKFPLKIKHLHDRESTVTASASCRRASAGLVEFSARANAGFPHD